MKAASDVGGLMKPYFYSFQRANMRKQRESRDSWVLERTEYRMI